MHHRQHITWTALTVLVASFGLLVTGCRSTTQTESNSQVPVVQVQDTALPAQVTVNAGASLSCELMSEPKVIGEVTATYSCAAPGAYLVSVDEENQTAEYFTTDSQSTTVTYGPATVPLVE